MRASPNLEPVTMISLASSSKYHWHALFPHSKSISLSEEFSATIINALTSKITSHSFPSPSILDGTAHSVKALRMSYKWTQLYRKSWRAWKTRREFKRSSFSRTVTTLALWTINRRWRGRTLEISISLRKSALNHQSWQCSRSQAKRASLYLRTLM